MEFWAPHFSLAQPWLCQAFRGMNQQMEVLPLSLPPCNPSFKINESKQTFKKSGFENLLEERILLERAV